MKWLVWIGGLCAAVLPAQADANAPAAQATVGPAPVGPATVGQARQWFDEGRFDAAFSAWRQLAAEAKDQPERQYNLALAAWRAGELDAARDAIERYAALARTPRTDLHRGLLGAIAFDEAKAKAALADADPAQAPKSLAEALAKATAAREHFVRGALAGGGAELRRNAERALRLEEELQKRIDELQNQAQEQQPQQQNQDRSPQDQAKDGKSQDPQSGEAEPSEPPSGEPPPDESQAGKPQSGAGEQDPSKPGETTPDPSTGGEGKAGEPSGEPPPPAEPKPGEPSSTPEARPSQDGQGQTPQPAAEPDPKGGDATPGASAGADAPQVPGETPAGRLLSQEQQKRLLDMLQQLERRQQALQARWKAQRPKVERDW